MPKRTQTAKTAKLLPPRRKTNAEVRTREYMTTSEVEQLCQAARQELRNGLRNAALILIMFRHALRVSEAISLRWDQVDFKKGLLHVKRIKKGINSTHPLREPKLRSLRQLQRDYPDTTYFFVSERKTPLSSRSVRHIVANTAINAGFTFPVHPYMLRHSTRFYLANKRQDTRAIQSYMGHANIKNTVMKVTNV